MAQFPAGPLGIGVDDDAAVVVGVGDAVAVGAGDAVAVGAGDAVAVVVGAGVAVAVGVGDGSWAAAFASDLA
ncbi:hypothetical protein [Pseudarthrobacter sp. N5]|uniref:hypothetical protein n=1 Tax=Pseudarthrobacter sp. N5 TaxID=3418416 RepID=UPI003CE6C732